MRATTERIIIRWIHIVISIPIVGFIYGPVSQLYYPSLMVRWVFFPTLVLTGLWMWKGHWLRTRLRKMRSARAS